VNHSSNRPLGGRASTKTVGSLHDRAMRLADAMLEARADARRHDAERLGRAALRSERRAAAVAERLGVSASTRVILLRSAANLARDVAPRRRRQPDL
jgi:hypothetical protein